MRMQGNEQFGANTIISGHSWEAYWQSCLHETKLLPRCHVRKLSLYLSRDNADIRSGGREN